MADKDKKKKDDKKKEEKKDDKKDKKDDKKKEEKKKDDKKDKKDVKDSKDKKKDDKKDKAAGAAKKGGESKAGKALKKEFDTWVDGDDETAQIEWKKLDSENGQITFRFGDAERFSVTFPDDYPNTDERFFVFSEAKTLSDDWSDKMNEFCDKSGGGKKPPLGLGALLSKAAELYLDLDDAGAGSDGDGSFGHGSDEEFPVEVTEKPKMRREDEVSFDKNKYFDIGSPAASLRLLKDLKEIGKSHELGFSAVPHKDNSSGKENLYHWEVKLFNFDKKSTLHQDLEQLKKSTQKDWVEIEMRFSKDYPFSPPFVRVVSPRFKFMTGHVTMGGSICMELLTNSGWRSTNSIESILIQIRAEMMEGGARVEVSSGNHQYGESEAWDAFYRAARNHGWDVNGLSSANFPKLY